MGGGPDVLEQQWILHGNMYDIAREVNGILFSLEPRFFGASQPTLDVSVDSLQYLSTEQQLADLANFIVHVKDSLNQPDAKVILYGDAMGATFVVWMRQQYPHLVDGAWASNSRLLTQFPDYRRTYFSSI